MGGVMWRRLVISLVLVALVGCGAKASSTPADTADDADGEPAADGAAPEGAVEELAAGASVCVEVLVGVRYPVEDALEEHGFEAAADCMFADAKLEEGGEAGAYFMRFQRVGESEWQRCDSTAENRNDFIAECVAQLAGDG